MRSIIFFMAMLLVVGCTTTRSSQNDEISPVDLDSIVRRGKLYVMTDYNSVNYFYYKGVAVGYQYELVKEYAKHLGVEYDKGVPFI